ncbi:LysR substrate-binding domain-containing protein [Ramlibacter sp. 2FC]|uniref:LysR family transcriptional regulator n=1 Tax=Ramlibacter sp. 2FC TaxID=2502188 RepID=UPI0010F9A475|nr:LysR substrate-binding domain-containing protein [Ramlibacter sp. 2FC]
MASILDGIPWARRLKLRHLEVFLAVHDTGSLTAAAAQLHMTQPALSHWLSDLEDVVGRPLFLRGRRLELTREGEVLRGHAARMLGDVQHADADLRAVQAGLQGRLHVGTGLPRVLLPKAIARLQQDRPGVFVSVVEAPLPQLLEMLARREVDVIIGALAAQALGSGFATEALISDSVQVVARRGHPSLQCGSPRWEDTIDYPWILPPVGSVMRDIFDAAFAAQHLTPPVPCVEANSSLRVQLLMGERNYVSILSSSEVQLYRPLGLIDHVPLVPSIPSPDIGAIWEADRTGALTSHFLDALRIESRSQ